MRVSKHRMNLAKTVGRFRLTAMGYRQDADCAEKSGLYDAAKAFRSFADRYDKMAFDLEKSMRRKMV